VRVVIQEDFAGELDDATAADLEDKLDKAFGTVRDLLLKGKPRQQGTVDALEDLRADLAKSYDRRLAMLRRDVLKAVRGE
jgi:hypothetical protein